MLFGIREDRREMLKRGYKSVSNKHGIALCICWFYLGSKRVDDEEVEWLLKDTKEGISFFDLSNK